MELPSLLNQKTETITRKTNNKKQRDPVVTALNLHARYPRFKSVSDLSLLTSDSIPPLIANVFSCHVWVVYCYFFRYTTLSWYMGRGIVIEIWIINRNESDVKLFGQRQQILKLTFRAVALYENQWKNDEFCVVCV